MKIIIIIVLALFISGCSEQYAPPEKAIKACIEKGWIPHYHSSIGATSFKCKPLENKE